MDPRVSVIIQTYNHERFIAGALDSVLAQETDFPVEIVVTEDCSTDSTLQIVEGYRERHPDRIRLIASPRNLNNNAVFNRALDAVRGEFVANMDGDDFWTDPAKLQRQVAYLDTHPGCALCFHNLYVLHEDGSRPLYPMLWWPLPRIADLGHLLGGNYIPNCSALVRQSAVAPPRPDWYEREPIQDWALWALAARTGTIDYIDDLLGAYRVHGTNDWALRRNTDMLADNVRFLADIERPLGAGHAARVQEARARFRKQLVAEYAMAGERTRAIAEMAKGLWTERRARSGAASLQLAGTVISTLLGRAELPAEGGSELSVRRRSRDDIRAAVSGIDEAVVALLRERDRLWRFLEPSPDTPAQAFTVAFAEPFRTPVAVSSPRRIQPYEHFLPETWIGFDPASGAAIEIRQTARSPDAARAQAYPFAFAFAITVADPANAGWVTLETAFDPPLRSPVWRVTVAIRAQSSVRAVLRLELSVPRTGGGAQRIEIGAGMVDETIRTVVMSRAVAWPSDPDPGQRPSLILFLPTVAGAIVEFEDYAAYLSVGEIAQE